MIDFLCDALTYYITDTDLVNDVIALSLACMIVRLCHYLFRGRVH